MTTLLFALTALLWGGGALATAMQAGITPAAWSVALRMALAGCIFLGYGCVRGSCLHIPQRDRAAVALQGVLFFALAFIAFYEATARIPSGLAALILSTSSIFASLIARIFLGTPISRGLVWGTLCGITGIAIIFLPGARSLETASPAGLAWALLAAIASGSGTVVGARNQRAGLPAVAVLGWGALIGAVACMLWAWVSAVPFSADTSSRYLLSLAYLAIAASCAAFMLYFELVRRLGPGHAAYTLNVVPLVAMGLSTVFENLVLNERILTGAIVILIGNLLVLRRKAVC